MREERLYIQYIRSFNVILIVMRYLTIGFAFFLDWIVYEGAYLITLRFGYLAYVVGYISLVFLVFALLRWWGRRSGTPYLHHDQRFLVFASVLDFFALLGGMFLYGIYTITAIIYILIFLYAILAFSSRLVWVTVGVGLLSYITSASLLLTYGMERILIFDNSLFTTLVYLVFTPIYLAAFVFMTYFIKRSLERQAHLLELENRLKSEFISTAAHQFRTPLSNIKWTVGLIEDAKNLTDRQKTYLDRIRQSSEMLVELNDLLTRITRVENNEYPFEMKSVSVEHWVRHHVEKFQNRIEREKTELIMQNPYKDFEVEMDPKEMGFVLDSLIDNALQYSPDGTKVELAWKKEKGMFVLSVTDEGRGIPQEDRDQIFTKFFRGTNTDLNATGAFVVHLYISRQIVKEHEGEITFTSQEGTGSTFTVRIPMEQETRST